LLRLLRGSIKPTKGRIQKADSLQIVYFDQNRELDPSISLRRALAPDSDSVVYQERVIHVAAWAARFLFAEHDLNRPVGSLSGGERARVLIAQLMLQPADVLLLDEPTNDLDIPTLEILEESLLEYRGALVLVTHDRYMLDRISTVVLGFDGLGGIERLADYQQWDVWQRLQQSKAAAKLGRAQTSRVVDGRAQSTATKKKLSFAESRESETIEERIVEAEQKLRTRCAALEDPAVMSDRSLLQGACVEINEAQKTIEDLYARWVELEQKKS
jgi:ATP-binding cassette subfamily F protein uup